MVFSNLVFLFVFLPIVILTYYLIRKELRNITLLFFSLIFYAWGEPKYVFLMLFSILMNYIFGILVSKYHNKQRPFIKKLILFLAIFGNLAMLGFFKYMNFLIDILNSIFSLQLEMEYVSLPIGISFYTFQAMSYVIDVYRRTESVQRNPFDLALYISLFPQLIAGPIVRYNEIVNQIKKRIISIGLFAEGVRLFIIGLSKKVIIANQVGIIADAVFNRAPSNISVSLAWIGIIAYTLQIYFDFSGYSQMAIGLGKMFGFSFPINFNYPYISKSISEFWRRWHITLSSWFRDYVYIPLGGNRVSKWKTYRNLFIVWGLTGLWHGASWTFVVWGLYYGLLIALERAWLGKILKKLWTPISHMYVILVFIIGWVFFRADNFSYSFEYIRTMFGLSNQPVIDKLTMFYIHDYWLILLIGIIGSVPVFPRIHSWVMQLKIKALKSLIQQLIIPIFYLALLLLCVIHLTNSTFNPFIYFRF